MTTTDEITRLREALNDIGGCGDGNCLIVKPTGMHTNGGCRCYRDPIKMQRTIYAYRKLVAALSTPSTTHSVGDREAMEQADYEAHLAIEKGIESGAVYWREGLEQVQATLSSALKSTPSSAGRAPTRAEDEALRTAHQSSTTLVEYLDTPPNIGTAEQAAQKCDALAATYPSGSEARSALHNAALMIRAIKDIPSAEGRQ